jgi:hypothetical protein
VPHVEVAHQRNMVSDDLARLRQINGSVQAQDIESAVSEAGEGCSAIAADVQKADTLVAADVLREGLQAGQQERGQIIGSQDAGGGAWFENYDAVRTRLEMGTRHRHASLGQPFEHVGECFPLPPQHTGNGLDANCVRGGRQWSRDKRAHHYGIAQCSSQESDGLYEYRDTGGKDHPFEIICQERFR